MDTDEHEENLFHAKVAKRAKKKILPSSPSRSSRDPSVCEIEIRAAHEIMAARTTQLALLVDQLMPALQTKPPMLAGNVFVGSRGAGIVRNVGRICVFSTH
jgi:hypothetical protein